MLRCFLIFGLLATNAVASCTFRPSSVPFDEGRYITYPDKEACWNALRARHLDVLDYDRPHMDVNASIESLRKGHDEHLVNVRVVRTKRMGGSSEHIEIYRCLVREEWCTSVDDLHIRFAQIRQDPKYLEKHAFWLLRQYWFQVFRHQLMPNVNIYTTDKGNGTHQAITGFTWRLGTQWLHGLATRVHSVVNASWVTTNTGANASCVKALNE